MPNADIDLKIDRKVFKGFNETTENQGILFVNKLEEAKKDKNETRLESYKKAFSEIGKQTLQAIWKDMYNNFHSIDSTNAKAPKLQTYIDAKIAFETDMKTLGVVDIDMMQMLMNIQEFIDLKQINAQDDRTKITSVPEMLLETASDPKINIPDPSDPKKWVMDWVIGEIHKRIELLAKEKDNVLGSLLNSTPSLAIAQELFDKNQTARDALITKNRKFSDINKGSQQKNYEDLLWYYGKAAWIATITWYECRKYPNTWADYIRIVGSWADGKSIEQDIKLGSSTDVLHRARAEAFKWDAKRSDTGSVQDNLNELDGKWSYAQFENILRWHAEPTAFLSWLLGKNLLEEISANKPKNDGDAKINRYYGVILEYIVSIKDEWLLTTYLNHVVVGNSIHNEYLWTNHENQVANFNKIVGKDKRVIDENSDNGKKLGQIKLQLVQNTSPQSLQETFKKWFDGLIDKFGPMLFSVLKMFGFGKWSLLKLFKNSKDKINEMYGKEYGLSGEAKNAIGTITDGYVEEDLQKELSSPPTGDQLKKPFKDDNEIAKYIEKFTTKDNFYQYISIQVFSQWLDKYNKKNKTEININDIVTITTDSEKKQSITGIKSDQFKSVMTSILKDDSTRSRVADANVEITTSTTGKVKDRWANEYFKNIDEAITNYGIKTKKDIVRYLTASLFSSKDLSYVMTESNLSNGLIYKQPKNDDKNNKPEESPAEKLSIKTDYADKDWIITSAGAAMKIHEIFEDYSNAPKILLFTPKKTWTPIKIEQWTVDDINTYIYSEGDNKWKRIPINEWDKISLPEKTPEISVNQQRETMKTDLNDTKKSTDKENFEKTDYTLNDNNEYQKQIDSLSWLFATEKNYIDIIWEKDMKTLKDITTPTNISHLKNMLIYRWLKQKWNTKDEIYGTEIMKLNENIASKIDSTKQTYAVETSADKGIIITVNEWSTKKWDIAIKNTGGKLETNRTEKTSA